jgi:hypothetical protein
MNFQEVKITRKATVYRMMGTTVDDYQEEEMMEIVD